MSVQGCWFFDCRCHSLFPLPVPSSAPRSFRFFVYTIAARKVPNLITHIDRIHNEGQEKHFKLWGPFWYGTFILRGGLFL